MQVTSRLVTSDKGDPGSPLGTPLPGILGVLVPVGGGGCATLRRPR